MILARGQDIELKASYPKSPADVYSTIRRLREREKRRPLTQPERVALGLAYYGAGQHLLFRAAMEKAIAEDPGDPAPHFYLGRHYGSDVQDFARSALHFRAALERKPSPDHQAYLGHALEMQGDREAALSLYRDAAAADSCHPVAAAGLARLGAARLDRLLACPSPHPVLLRELAKMLAAANRHAEAARCLEEVLAAEPSNAAAAYQLHRAWRAAGDAAKAGAALERYREISAVYGGQ